MQDELGEALGWVRYYEQAISDTDQDDLRKYWRAFRDCWDARVKEIIKGLYIPPAPL